MHQPLILNVPGLHNSGPSHWQTLWEQQIDGIVRVEMGGWERPHRNTWVNALNLAIRGARRPVVLVAHSLGCHAVAWWAELESPGPDSPVIGAFLVAPPDVDEAAADSRLHPFSPTPRRRLPFPSVLAASGDDPYITLAQAERLAYDWGSRFAYLGEIGHINADSGLGAWPRGQALLADLIHQSRRPFAVSSRRFAPNSRTADGAASAGRRAPLA